MYCKFCGKEISDDSEFCRNCGKRISENNGSSNTTNGLTKGAKIAIFTYILYFFVVLMSLQGERHEEFWRPFILFVIIVPMALYGAYWLYKNRKSIIESINKTI